MYNTKLLFCFALVIESILALFVFNKNTFAYFNDNFSNLDNWKVVPWLGNTDNSWRIENSKLIGEISRGNANYLRLVTNPNYENFELNIQSQNLSGVDQPILFKVSDNLQSSYMVNIKFNDPYWPQDRNKISLGKFINGQYYNLSEVVPDFEITQNVVHKISITYNFKRINVFFDNKLIIDYTDDDEYLSGFNGFALLNWGGAYYSNSKNVFSSFIVKPILSEQKIVVIPGLGASWNEQEMVFNQNSNEPWKMMPFVKNYDSLIEGLEKNGLTKNEDFFVWNYDWRKPVSEITKDLNVFINSKINKDDNLILLGHSLGGVVARIWSQDYKNDGWNNIVYTFGSPNQGSIAAYEAWNGGKLSEKVDTMSIALNVLLILNGGSPNINTLRNYAPVLKDLLPTFDFLEKSNKVVPSSNMFTVNSYLNEKNQQFDTSGVNLFSYSGIGLSTIEKIKVGDRGIFDKVSNLWPDGKPIKYIYGDGDGTVLKNRSKLSNTNYDEINSDHGSVVDKSLSDLFERLNLSEKPNDETSENYNNSLVFYMGSPADFSVKCDNKDKVDDIDGWVLIKNNNYGKCLVNIIGSGNGIYHFVAGKTDGVWNYFENNIGVGVSIGLVINPSDGSISAEKENVSFLEESINYDLTRLLDKYPNNIDLAKTKSILRNKNYKTAIDSSFNFRKVNKENETTERMIKNIGNLWKLNISMNNTQAKNIYLNSLQKKSLIDKIALLNSRKGVLPSKTKSESYYLASNYIEEAIINLNRNQTNDSYVQSYLSAKYLDEAQ